MKPSEKSRGIILKNHSPHKNKLTIFDERYGKITAVPQNVRTINVLRPGFLVEYHASHEPHFFRIAHTNITEFPLALAQTDLSFVHHILELCYQLAPLNHEDAPLFTILLHLYHQPELFTAAAAQKIFACKALIALGIHPHHDAADTSVTLHEQDLTLLTLFFSNSVDTLVNGILDSDVEMHLDTWLKRCLSAHPYLASFKTVNFLSSCGAV